MSKDLPVPNLTLEADLADKEVEADIKTIKDGAALEQPYFKDFPLTTDEKKMVDDFAGKINLMDSDVIVQYGSGAQKKMADFSESALSMIKTKDLGAIGEVLTNVVTELKGFDVNEKSSGIMGFFKRGANKIEAVKVKYEKAEANIDKICSVLEQHQIQLLKDIAMLDKMYELNNVYFKELSMYILAGKKKLSSVRSAELPDMISKARLSGLPEDAQAANDLGNICERFEKKLHDLELTKAVSLQAGPQIRLVQSNNIVMSEKIQSTVTNTIPLWKSQMVIAIGISHSLEAAKAQRAVSETTNELLRRNAETLQIATTTTAQESERGIVDMETLRFTNEKLIATIDEVLRIQEDGRAKRRQAETELAKIENDLKEKLLTINK